MPSKPYDQRTDLDKLQSQWHKLSGLHTREEWSAAVVRAATAAEIAANFAIRTEFTSNSNFDAEFINSQLKWANGLNGKIRHLLQHLWKNQAQKYSHLTQLLKLADAVASKRNAVVHQGEFCNETEATEAIASASKFITNLVQLYQPAFKLMERTSKKL
jgi:hypothetical protein